MLILLTAIVAAMLVTGQALWKSAAGALNTEATFSIYNLFFKILLTPKFIIGAFFYVVATLVYVWLFSKFPYNQVQLTLLTFSVLFSITIALIIFKEHLALINFFGVALLIMGIVFITWKV